MDKIYEENNTFFITLSSSDSLNYHPKNIQANFTVQFDKNIDLLRNMEVGLVEINLPKYKYTNIPKSEIRLIIEDLKKYVLWKFHVEENYASNTLEFFSHIKLVLSKLTDEKIKEWLKVLFVDNDYEHKDIQFLSIIHPTINLIGNKLQISKGFINIKTQEVSSNLWSGNMYRVYFEFDKSLHHLINFPDNSSNKLIYISKEIILKHFQNVFIFCDLVKASIIGDKKENIIKMISKIDIDKNTLFFNPIQFLPVNKHIFDSISIMIKDDENNIINFLKDSTRLVLLFRPLEHI